MKVIIFEYDKMVRAGQLINSITATGASNFRALAELADIIDSGQPGDYEEHTRSDGEHEPDKKEDAKDAMEHKEV